MKISNFIKLKLAHKYTTYIFTIFKSHINSLISLTVNSKLGTGVLLPMVLMKDTNTDHTIKTSLRCIHIIDYKRLPPLHFDVKFQPADSLVLFFSHKF